MSDVVTVDIVQGEIERLFGDVKAVSGTLTIIGVPTVKVLDKFTLQTLIDSVSVTGFDVDPAAQVKAWYLFDTTDVAPGTYLMIFTVVVADANGNESTKRPEVIANVLRVDP